MELYSITFPGGSDTQMQYNNGGIFGGANAYWDDVNDRFGIGTTAPDRKLEINTGAATDGIRLAYNDADGSAAIFSDWLLDSSGDTKFSTAGDFILFEGVAAIGGTTENMFLRFFSSSTCIWGSQSGLSTISWDINLKMDDDKTFVLGGANNFGMDYDSSGNFMVIKHPLFSTTGQWFFKGDDTLEFWSPNPSQTYRNTTHEDTDGGRESRINYVGEQSGGEATTLARIEASHDGAADDEKGKLVFSTNATADTDTPTDQMKIQSTGDWVINKTSGTGLKVDLAAPTFGFADLLGDQFSKNTGGTKPTLTTYNGAIDAWQFSDGDEAFLSFHIPHDYVPSTDIHLHIHWSQTSATATGGTLDFKYFAIYAKGHNQASGSTFTGTPITATFSSIDINDGSSGLSQYQHHLTEVTISAATATAALFDRDDFEPDGVIELTLEMDANNLTNSGAVLDPFIHYADIHYQTNGVIGTKSRTPDFYT